MLLKEASLVIGRQKKGLSMEKSFLFYARVLVVGSGISRALVPHRRRTWRQGVHGPVLKCLDTDFFPHRFPFTVLGPALGANFETPFKSAWHFCRGFPYDFPCKCSIGARGWFLSHHHHHCIEFEWPQKVQLHTKQVRRKERSKQSEVSASPSS